MTRAKYIYCLFWFGHHWLTRKWMCLLRVLKGRYERFWMTTRHSETPCHPRTMKQWIVSERQFRHQPSPNYRWNVPYAVNKVLLFFHVTITVGMILVCMNGPNLWQDNVFVDSVDVCKYTFTVEHKQIYSVWPFRSYSCSNTSLIWIVSYIYILCVHALCCAIHQVSSMVITDLYTDGKSTSKLTSVWLRLFLSFFLSIS